MTDIQKVVVLGANGTMGAGSAETFAAGGCRVTLLARTRDKAEAAIDQAKNLAKSERIGALMSAGTYDDDMDEAVAEADLIFEALAEEMVLKKHFFTRVDHHRRSDSIVGTVSSGLSITDMGAGRSESFRKNFLGIHLFNPPNVIVGTEVIPHAGTDPKLVTAITEMLERRFGRVVTLCRDMPAFAGNRVGFKVLNEVAQHAEHYGIAFMDYLIGPYTGRAMPPLATVDLVGFDVHKAIVDNVYDNTEDEAHSTFELPHYMQKMVDNGQLGNKAGGAGGFYKRIKGEDGKTTALVLDPASGSYKEPSQVKVPKLSFIEEMRELHRVGCYEDAFKLFIDAPGPEADLARKIVFGYISYGLNRVGENEVVREPRDVDRIMGFGFNWAPPTVLVDVIGLKPSIAAIERSGLQVPTVLKNAKPGERLFREPHVNIGRFFAA